MFLSLISCNAYLRFKCPKCICSHLSAFGGLNPQCRPTVTRCFSQAWLWLHGQMVTPIHSVVTTTVPFAVYPTKSSSGGYGPQYGYNTYSHPGPYYGSQYGNYNY